MILLIFYFLKSFKKIANKAQLTAFERYQCFLVFVSFAIIFFYSRICFSILLKYLCIFYQFASVSLQKSVLQLADKS